MLSINNIMEPLTIGDARGVYFTDAILHKIFHRLSYG